MAKSCGRVARPTQNTRGKRSAITPSAPAQVGDSSSRPGPAAARLCPTQLATLVKNSSRGRRWLSEIKFDGYRMLLRVARPGPIHQLAERPGLDRPVHQRAGRRRRSAARAASPRRRRSCHAPARRHTSFRRCRTCSARGHTRRAAVLRVSICCISTGTILAGLPLEQRKRLLESVIVETDRGPLRYVEHIVGSGQTFFEHACRMGLEIVCQALGAALSFRPRRGLGQDEVPTAGRVRDCRLHGPAGAGPVLGPCCSAITTAQGRVGLRRQSGHGLQRAEPGKPDRPAQVGLSRSRSPLATPAPAAAVRRAHWVAATSWWPRSNLPSGRATACCGILRSKACARTSRPPRWSATARNLRPPRPGTTVMPTAASTGGRAETMAKRNSKSAAAEPVAAGVRITHPERVLYADVGLTKMQQLRRVSAGTWPSGCCRTWPAGRSRSSAVRRGTASRAFIKSTSPPACRPRWARWRFARKTRPTPTA